MKIFSSIIILTVSIIQSTQSFSTPYLPSLQPIARTHAMSSSSLSYTNAPEDNKSSGTNTSFQKRMRDIMLARQRKRTTIVPHTDKTSPKQEIPNLQTASTLMEYKNLVGDETSRMVVVRFYATWCKSCRAVAPLFYRLARQHPNIQFVDVAVTERNADLHQGLGVPSVPFAHIYHPEGGLVEERGISRKSFGVVERMVGEYERGLCDLEEGHVESPYEDHTEIEP